MTSWAGVHGCCWLCLRLTGVGQAQDNVGTVWGRRSLLKGRFRAWTVDSHGMPSDPGGLN